MLNSCVRNGITERARHQHRNRRAGTNRIQPRHVHVQYITFFRRRRSYNTCCNWMCSSKGMCNCMCYTPPFRTEINETLRRKSYTTTANRICLRKKFRKSFVLLYRVHSTVVQCNHGEKKSGAVPKESILVQ